MFIPFDHKSGCQKVRKTILPLKFMINIQNNREITSLEVVETVYELMGWDRNSRYKAPGHIANSPRGIIMVYELTFGYDQDIDRTKTMYFSCYLSGISRNDAGKIASDYNVKMDYGTGMDLSYSAYADKDQLYREVVLGRGGNFEDLTADLVK